jgi:hypothetical protein
MRVSGCWRQLGRERGEGVLLAGSGGRFWAVLLAASVDGVLLAASVHGVLLAASVDGVLLAASVGIALSPPASVVVLLKSDFLAYFC